MNKAFFEIRNAWVWHGNRLALDDFSLRLEKGQSVAILGPNGAGKSTFLKLLTGEMRPESRAKTSCQLFGEDRWSLEEIRHRIGVVMPEEVARFDPEELVKNAVVSSMRGAFGITRDMRFSNADRQQALHAMTVMKVDSLVDRGFGSLSSGEKRRILIARALVQQPEVLVLDEPSTALDFAASLQLIANLRALVQQGKDLVLVTHHPGEILPEMDRVILLKEGKVFADGPKRKILTTQNLTELYGVDLRVRWSGGWCDVRAAD